MSTTPSSALPTTSDALDELVDVVDLNNAKTAVATRHHCHTAGLPHRSAHIFLFRTRKPIASSATEVQVLLQQRSTLKSVGAELWDLSVAEHLSSEETYEQAILRGLKEELCLQFQNDALLNVRAPYLSRQVYQLADASVNENMFTATFAALYEEQVHGKVRFDESEVQQVEWWPVNHLVKKLKEKQHMFTRWLRLELQNINLVELANSVTAHMAVEPRRRAKAD